jgi:hypothetical protein
MQVLVISLLKQLLLANDVEVVFASKSSQLLSRLWCFPCLITRQTRPGDNTSILSLLPDLGGTKFWERAGIVGLLGALFFFGLDQESAN